MTLTSPRARRDFAIIKMEAALELIAEAAELWDTVDITLAHSRLADAIVDATDLAAEITQREKDGTWPTTGANTTTPNSGADTPTADTPTGAATDASTTAEPTAPHTTPTHPPMSEPTSGKPSESGLEKTYES